jgi:glycosyltransferase involved in cell wall biosynthesis
MISILILTKNEQEDLPGCLESVAWSDDVHVFDSLSTDRTIEIARASNAQATTRRFENYAAQRNAALHTLPFKHDWVLSLDADERIPERLSNEMMAFVRTASSEVVAARIRRRDFFMGTWLKHAQISPYYVRLVRPSRVHYEREINEVLVADGMIADLREPFDHYPFSKGISHWVEKHNRYSTMEAERALRERQEGQHFSLKHAIFSRDFNERRKHQKGLFYKLPGRPFLKLFYMLFVRRAIFDGKAGITYSFLQTYYEYLIVIKERELQLKSRAVSSASQQKS